MTYTQLRIYGKYVILLRLKELCQFTYMWTLHLSSTKTDNSRCYVIKSKQICDVWDLHSLYGYAIFSVTVTLNIGGVMYLNTTVKIPEIKGKIITKKKGTTTYILYQYGSEYRPEKQYSVPLRTIVGKISDSDAKKTLWQWHRVDSGPCFLSDHRRGKRGTILSWFCVYPSSSYYLNTLCKTKCVSFELFSQLTHFILYPLYIWN